MAARPRHSAFRLDIDPQGVGRLVADLRELEGGRRQVAALRRNLKRAAEPAAEQIRRNAAWSARIPPAVGVRTAFSSKRGAEVSVIVNRAKAPHARPYEFGSQGNNGALRHPVFGNTDVWVSQASRPFFFRDLESRMPQVEQAASAAIEAAARQAGFH